MQRKVNKTILPYFTILQSFQGISTQHQYTATQRDGSDTSEQDCQLLETAWCDTAAWLINYVAKLGMFAAYTVTLFVCCLGYSS